jgi:hypothetical protein
MLKKILLLLVVAAAGVVAFAATRPGSYRVERAISIEAPASVVFAQLDDFKAWKAWSPWEGKDPAMNRSHQGPARGVGAAYAWQGNSKVGEGKMSITDSQPPVALRLKLELFKPCAALATTTFAIKPDGSGSVAVRWAMEGDNNLVAKLFGLLVNRDTMIGGDFEKGLASLKQVAEAEATKQAAMALAATAQAASAAAAEKARVEATAALVAAPKEPQEGAAPSRVKVRRK